MKIESLTGEKCKFWLTKTTKTICAAARRGSTDMEKNTHLAELCTKYNELKEKAIELNVWAEYCEAGGFAPEHDGFDCAA